MHRAFIFCLVAVYTLARPVGAKAADFQRSFGVAADDHVLWAYVRYPDPVDHELGLHFAYARVSDSGVLQPWRHSGLVGIRGQIRFAVVSGTRLHVFYSDGSHIRYDTPLPSVQSPRSTERKLPRSALPLALGSEPGSGSILALVDRVTAEQLTEELKQVQAVNRNSASIGSESSSPSAESGVTSLPGDSDFFIVRYTGTRWVHETAVPHLPYTVQRWWLIPMDGALHLTYQANTSDGLSLFYMTLLDRVWSSPKALLLAENQETLDCVPLGNSPAAILRQSEKLAIHWLVDESTSIELDPGNAPAGFFNRDLVVARWKGGLALSTLDEQEQVWIGYWSNETGQPVLAPGAIPPLTPRRQPVIDRSLQSLLSFVGLAVIMATIFARRRESILHPLPTPEGTVLATHMKRVFAFTLDAVFSSPLVLGSVYGVATLRAIDIRLLFTDYSALEPFWMRSFGLWLAACTAFLLYCVVFEWFWSATPGKRVLNCRVVRENGLPCSLTSVVLRNLARLVEFFLPFQGLPVIVLVLLTRNRQRLGDLIAGTLVVETLPQSTSQPEAPAPP